MKEAHALLASNRLLPGWVVYLLPRGPSMAAIDPPSLPPQVAQLFQDLRELGVYILDMMRNHLMVIDLKSQEGIAQMREHIKWVW